MYYIISFLAGVLVGFILTKIFSKKVKQFEIGMKADISKIYSHMVSIDEKVETGVKTKIKDLEDKMDNLEKKLDSKFSDK